MALDGKNTSVVRQAIDLAIFSSVANGLALVIPLYLLQVYDRVLAAGSLETLLYLTLIAVVTLVVLGIIDTIRARYANRVAARLDRDAGAALFTTAMNGPRAPLGDIQPLRDLATARTFIASRTMLSLFDLPFAPLFIGALYLIHPLLCLVTATGLLVLVAAAALNQWAASRKSRAAAEALGASTTTATAFARHVETVKAMGMLDDVTDVWGASYARAARATDAVTSVNAAYGSAARTLRMLLQIAILCTGAVLVLDGGITAGMIFASSLISARALQPLDQLIGSWPQIIEAWRAGARIRRALEANPPAVRRMIQVAAPRGALALEDVIYHLPGGENGAPLIKKLTLQIAAGESLAVIGQSQAGKSTLARLMVGAVAPHAGTVRLDGADIGSWDRHALAAHVGYLSQDSEVFPGTIAENIARFRQGAADADIVAAAERAQVHAMILRMKKGYLTEIGPAGVRLSGGERQRIGLARAFFADPRLVVLDEPNANLDGEGEAALERTIAEAKNRGTTVILITHRPAIAARCDRILFLRDGQIELIGPAAQVLQRLSQGGAMAPVREEDPAAALREMARRMQAGDVAAMDMARQA